MPKKPAPPAPYPLEFRRRLIELVRAGQSPEELARKFEPTAQSIRTPCDPDFTWCVWSRTADPWPPHAW